MVDGKLTKTGMVRKVTRTGKVGKAEQVGKFKLLGFMGKDKLGKWMWNRLQVVVGLQDW